MINMKPSVPAAQLPLPTIEELFHAGQKVVHINAKKIVTVGRDDGGPWVFIDYPGGKSQQVPRGALAVIALPNKKPRKAKGIPGVVPPERAELKIFMREITSLELVKSYADLLQIDVNLSPKSFGMIKMQLMNKLYSMIASGHHKMADYWELWQLLKSRK